ncbi:hypothetical protein BUALT_Bualt07G0109700 [Buddleja alternifolia]|uniref:Transferase, transferring glycosyl groups n=1 Tax=Buddleja alternifolia TaxID=168488 RepID=A0AAV6XHZ0_9LAMI|nr:hypothetical protein BUALT_Bualt07G0109700 [Buddleja alternifolia]
MADNKFMISPKPTIPLSLSLLSLSLFLLPLLASPHPTPTPWPLQFHSILFMNNTKGNLQVVDLWYDWPNRRNFNIIQNQLGKKLYDLEWGNGTSYYYTLDENKECKTRLFPVGILRPNWLDGANYVGEVYRDGFLCNVWEKVDFITYYEDVATKRPVSWAFYTGMVAHVMTFEVGKVLDDPNWQAPVYCFEDTNHQNKPILESTVAFPTDHRSLMRDVAPGIPMVI